jgi:hypothetical protein
VEEANGKGRNHIKERQSLDSPHFSYSSRTSKDGTFADTIRTSMLRRGYHDVLPERVGLLQVRRRGYSDSRQFFPLKISVPPTSTLCDIEGRFENPRKAPLPQGLKYNTTQTSIPPQPSSDTPPGTIGTFLSTLWLTIIDIRSPELNNLSQASVFALPKFDAEKEMRMLQNLWTKRCSIGDPPPLICRSPQLSQDITEIVDSSERSFFESDSDSEDEEVSNKRYVPQLT